MSVVGKSVVEQRHLDVVRVLLEAKADLSLTNAEGKTALQQATAPEMRLALGGQAGTGNVASGRRQSSQKSSDSGREAKAKTVAVQKKEPVATPPLKNAPPEHIHPTSDQRDTGRSPATEPEQCGCHIL